MRHKHKGRKLGTDHGHTKAMKVSLVQALFLNDRIKTTETRAKEIRGHVDKIITWAKKGDLHSRRLAISALGNDSELTREIFEKVSQGMFEGRPGGYTRIMKLGPRKGDGARMVIMELVNETCVPKAERKAAKAASATKKTAAKKTTAKKAAPKKADDKEALKEAEEEVKAQEKENDANRENAAQRIHDSIEAAEEEGAKEIREEGERQLAEEKAAAAEGDAAESDGAEADDSDKEDLKEAAKEALEKKEEAGKSDKADAENKDKAEEKVEVREEEFKAEEASAEEAKAEDNAPNPADMPESEERAR